MPHPLDAHTLVYGFSSAGEPQVSPDGTRLLYTLARADEQTKKTSSNVWMVNIDGSKARQLTTSGERNGGARWSPDGLQIAFVSDRASGQIVGQVAGQGVGETSLAPTGSRGTSAKKYGIYVMPVGEAGEARALTSHAEPISDLTWSPDGTQIVYTTLFDPQNPDEREQPKDAAPKVKVIRRLDYKQDNRGYLGDKRSQVFVVDVATGKRRQLTHTPVDSWQPQWSPDGKQLAVRTMRPDNWSSQLVVLDAATGREAQRFGPEDGVVQTWAWSPDGKRILYAGDTDHTAQLDLFLADVTSGAVRRLTNDLHCLPDSGFTTITPPAQPVWLDDRVALFHAFEHGRSGLYTVDTETGAVETLTRYVAVNGGLSGDAAHNIFAQAHMSFERVGEISVFDRATGATRIVTDYSGPVLRESRPASAERMEVQRGKYTIEAWLLKPADFDPAKRYPVILDVHGGPQGYYGHLFNANQQNLAANGFLVVISNPRGSSSYGREFTQQVIRDWGGEDYVDLMAILDAVLKRPYADAERTGIYGYSYGGYMTSWTISQTQRFAAAVCGAPCFDLESMFGTSDIGSTFGGEQWGGTPAAEREWYAKHSPSTYAHQTRTPTLIVHGEADERCPIGQSEQMFTTLSRAGCEVEFVRYPGGSHLFLRGGPSEHREDYYTRVLAWFKSHLGEPTEPASVAASQQQTAGATTE